MRGLIMGFVQSVIFWIIYALIPFAITILFGLSRQTMVYIYFAATLIAIFIWWLYDKKRKQAPKEY